MLYREVGSSGMMASVVSMGTWAAGGDAAWGEKDDASARQAIDAAIDCGINLIDTAPSYGFGHSERLVGKAIKKQRAQVIVSTKCGLSWDNDEGSLFLFRDGKNIYRNLSTKAIIKGAEQSLSNLGTDYIDIFMTHWQSVKPSLTPISETMGALTELKAQGKIRAIGISNVTHEQAKEYLRYGKVDLVQARYSMLTRENESLICFCNENKITFQPYMPLEQGLLIGKIMPDTVIPPSDIRSKNIWYRPKNRVRILNMLNGWGALCKKYNCSLSSIVISWTMSRSAIVNVLCGARKVEHVIENAKAGDLILDSSDIETINNDIDRLLNLLES